MVTSKKLGIAIWSEKSHEDKKAQIDTVLVFRRGYYD
jgi:hypothetical protein